MAIEVTQKRRGIGAWLLDALFPRFCVSCGDEGDLLCRICCAKWKTDPITHQGDEEHLPVFALFSYADPIARRLLQAWKYGFDERAWDILRGRMQEYIPHVKIWMESIAKNHPGQGQALVPVPLFYTRYNERGFDQAADVALAYSALLGIECKTIVKRTRPTEPQAQKTEEERKNSYLHNPFTAEAHTQGLNCFVVDDVYTTGATARAVGSALAIQNHNTLGYLVLFIGK